MDESRKVAIPGYLAVYGALIALALFTTGLAYLDLGPLSTVIALAIAGAKATLVILYFMHVRYAPAVTRLFVGVGFFFLGILFALTLSDVFTRLWLSPFVGGSP
jgi:cytochrome c oxidase subunit IV